MQPQVQQQQQQQRRASSTISRDAAGSSASASSWGVQADRQGWLEMKTMIGWSPRWCELRGKHGQLIRSHEKDDRSTRKLSDIRGSVVCIEPGHSQDRYLEVAYARSPEAGVHTLRLRAPSAKEALAWLQTIQRAQQLHQKQTPGATRVFTLKKDPGGSLGLTLRRAVVDKVEAGSPAALAGLQQGMQITRVCDTVIKLNDELMAAQCIYAAPPSFEVEVCLPLRGLDSSGLAVRPSFPRAIVLLALAGKRSRTCSLSAALLRSVGSFLAEETKLLVVLWGWGSTVESRHVLVPAYDVTPADVHRSMNADTKWHAAREEDAMWDSKAIFFTGPASGPTAGEQRRVRPDEHLAKYLGVGLCGGGQALHMVSVEAKAHLTAFVASAEGMQSPQKAGTRGGGGAAAAAPPVPHAEHVAVVQEKDAEIARLRRQVAGLRTALSELQARSGAVPWDEEEPSIVTALRDRVVAAGTLEELESVDFPEAEAGFFTPVGSPANSDHWGGVDESVLSRFTPPIDSVALSNCSWVGPAGGLRPGTSGVAMRPKGPIDDMPPMSVCDGWAEGWHLRNIGYKKTGEKVPSLESLYTLKGMDIYRSANPLENVARHFKLPVAQFETGGLPPCFVFNLQVPFCEAPSVWGQEPGGPTVNIIATFALKKSVAEDAANIPAARLMSELHECVSEDGSLGTASPFLGRFKMLVRAEKGVPKVFSRYNGKPVLVTRSGKLFKTKDYLEVDCNLRNWAYAARTALYSLWNAVPQYKLHVGFCIEARDDREMPERIVGCCQMVNADLENVPEWDEAQMGSPSE